MTSRILFPLAIIFMLASLSPAEDLSLKLRYQEETSPNSGRFHQLLRDENWNPKETAIIVCDVWDLHHCKNAVDRLTEFVPRLNEVLNEARQRGVTIIHSPSDCMPAYVDHAARQRAIKTPPAAKLPKDIEFWCSRIPAEEKAAYPVDQSDGGEDDDPEVHKQWAAHLTELGRNAGTPWKTQNELITIDEAQDYISDRGDEVWNILENRGIKNVILTGVHTNMCVLGRPFGLRQMKRNGKQVVLMRDMTDTMYNPQRWPYVSHFTGTDLIISHVERFVCPTITSDQFLGGEPFRFKNDKRPHVVIVMAEDEYQTEQTLPKFAAKHLGRDFRVSYVYGSEKERNSIAGIEILKDADVALISIRRRVLPPSQMQVFKEFVAAGKPVIGIRTASHAFSLRNEAPPEGLEDWPELDAQVYGGNYSNHYGNELKSTVRIDSQSKDHPILRGFPTEPIAQGGSLYVTSPLAKNTQVLLTGRVEGHEAEPVAWTFQRDDGGKSFYTSLGHIKDFENPAFVRLLYNAVHWAAGLPIRKDISIATAIEDYEQHWTLMPVPSSWEAGSAGVLKHYDGVGWYRCAVRVPADWINKDGLVLKLKSVDDTASCWLNGQKLERIKSTDDKQDVFAISADAIASDDANLIVIRIEDGNGEGGLRETPILSAGKDREIPLKGNWQFRIGDNASFQNMPLPAKFGMPTDVFFE